MGITDLSSNIFLAILQIAFYLSVPAIGAYIYLKFQNLAKKEDLAEITEIVETVKADLKVITDKKFELYQEQKRVLLEFYLSIDDFITTFVDTHFFEDEDSESEKVTDLIYIMQSKWHGILTKQGALNFFIEDNSVITAVNELIKKLGNVYLVAHRNMRKYIRMNETVNTFRSTIDESPASGHPTLINEMNDFISKREYCENMVVEQKFILRDEFRQEDLKQFADLCRTSLIHNED